MLSIVARDPAISQSYYIRYQLCCCDCESLGSPRPCSSQSDQAADSPGETNNPVVACLDRMKTLLSAARSNPDIPVLWTQVHYRAGNGMRDAGLFYAKSKVLDVWEAGDERGLWKCVEGLEPKDGEQVVVKRHPSAFFGTELVGMLNSLGVDTLVICGVSTSGCVRATALDAMCYNYRPMVSFLVAIFGVSEVTILIVVAGRWKCVWRSLSSNPRRQHLRHGRQDGGCRERGGSSGALESWLDMGKLEDGEWHSFVTISSVCECGRL